MTIFKTGWQIKKLLLRVPGKRNLKGIAVHKKNMGICMMTRTDDIIYPFGALVNSVPAIKPEFSNHHNCVGPERVIRQVGERIVNDRIRV